MYEEEYYFIRDQKNDDRIPFLTPDKDTSNRNYDFEALPLGQMPLKFHNGFKEERRRKGIKSITPELLFSGFDIVVDDNIRERLLNYDFPNLHIYPAIYIDDQDQWHEDRWYLTFTERFDCWDRNSSDYEQDVAPVRLGGIEYHQIYSLRFNQELFAKTPLSQRLLFKLGGSIDAYIVAHQSILTKIFGHAPDNGAEYIRVSDF